MGLGRAALSDHHADLHLPGLPSLRGGRSRHNADALLGIATGIAGFVLAVIAPILGRRSDVGGRRKFWLMTNTYLLVGIMIASFFVEPKAEFLIFGLVLY